MDPDFNDDDADEGAAVRWTMIMCQPLTSVLWIMEMMMTYRLWMNVGRDRVCMTHVCVSAFNKLMIIYLI